MGSAVRRRGLGAPGVYDQRMNAQRPPRPAHPGEARLPAALAVLVAIALYAALPDTLILGPRVVVPVLEIALLIPLVAFNPRRMTRENRVMRRISIALVLVTALANTIALVLLIDQLLQGHPTGGKQFLLGAGQVWLTNIIIFALAYWELDRGGPVRRTQVSRRNLPPADFRFPQDEDHDAVQEVAARASITSGWTPGFVDYLYVSLTNSSAFSPTDTMPLTPRAKMLMGSESVSAILLSVLVIARGVSLLG